MGMPRGGIPIIQRALGKRLGTSQNIINIYYHNIYIYPASIVFQGFQDVFGRLNLKCWPSSWLYGLLTKSFVKGVFCPRKWIIDMLKKKHTNISSRPLGQYHKHIDILCI